MTIETMMTIGLGLGLSSSTKKCRTREDTMPMRYAVVAPRPRPFPAPAPLVARKVTTGEVATVIVTGGAYIQSHDSFERNQSWSLNCKSRTATLFPFLLAFS